MRYTTRVLKTALPLYQGPVTAKQKLRKSHSDRNPGEIEYYVQRITRLELELQALNFLDHPLLIVKICNQIRVLRKQISRFEN